MSGRSRVPRLPVVKVLNGDPGLLRAMNRWLSRQVSSWTFIWNSDSTARSSLSTYFGASSGSMKNCANMSSAFSKAELSTVNW